MLSCCATRRGEALGSGSPRFALVVVVPQLTVLVPSLQGVPVAYDNVKVVGELGNIHDDQGFIHLDVEADFVIFSPKKGKKMVVCKYVDINLIKLGLSPSKTTV